MFKYLLNLSYLFLVSINVIGFGTILWSST